VRGPGGGYRLAKDSARISVAEIILAVDEPIDATQCGGKENCRDEQKCLTHDLWATLNERIFGYLEGVTLRQLVDNQRTRESGVNTVRDMRANPSKGAIVSA
jgi:Rrf2 family iron-sulfur cluster assembly transcriptional regulator